MFQPSIGQPVKRTLPKIHSDAKEGSENEPQPEDHSATDELLRIGLKASLSGATAIALHWWHHRQ